MHSSLSSEDEKELEDSVIDILVDSDVTSHINSYF